MVPGKAMAERVMRSSHSYFHALSFSPVISGSIWSVLTLIKNALQKDGHQVTCAEKITKELESQLLSYDLILLDVMMPEMDGYTFCQNIRNLVNCPILFLTAKNSEEDVTFGLALGGYDYIRKPFSIIELRARIQAHLRRENREKSQCLSIS